MTLNEDKVKVRPDVLMLTILDDIRYELVQNRRALEAFKPLMEEAAPQGLVIPLNLAVTGAIQELRCSPVWYNCTILNDGPNSVYVDVNRDQNARLLTTPIHAGEHLDVNYEKMKITMLFLCCLAGQTANVRIFAMI